MYIYNLEDGIATRNNTLESLKQETDRNRMQMYGKYYLQRFFLVVRVLLMYIAMKLKMFLSILQ